MIGDVLHVSWEKSVIFTRRSSYVILFLHYEINKWNMHRWIFHNKIYKMHLENTKVIFHFMPTLLSNMGSLFFFPSQGVQEKVNLTSPLLLKDDPIFTSLSLKLGQSVDEIGHRIHQALLKVSWFAWFLKFRVFTVMENHEMLQLWFLGLEKV